MGFSPLSGVPVRLGYYLAVAVVVGSFLALTPERRLALTGLGGHTTAVAALAAGVWALPALAARLPTRRP